MSATGNEPPPAPELEASGSGRRRKRKRWRALLAALILLLAVDLARAPQRQATARLMLGAIDLYQAGLSPVLETGGVRCRFTPTCSRYAEASIERHGALVGTLRATGRIFRCGPWTPYGTIDPP